MPRRSSVDSLPQEILDRVLAMLGDGGWTLDEVVEYLDKAGHPRSRSALHRKQQTIAQVSEKLKKSRDITKALVEEMGPNAVEGQTGRLLVEITQSLVFKHLTDQLDAEETEGEEKPEAPEPIDLMRLARTIKELTQAQKLNAERELKIRQETAAQAADVAEDAAVEAGLTAERAREIREKVLGIRPQAQ